MIGFLGALLIGSLIGAAANVGTSIYETETNKAMNRENNEFAAAEAEKQRTFSATEAEKVRDFEERLSNTAISRQVEDAKNAGINPTALAVGTHGASTPGASSAQGMTAMSSGFAGAHGFGNTINSLSYLAGSAMKLNQLKGLVGSDNVYKFSKSMTSAKDARNIAKLADTVHMSKKDMAAINEMIKSSPMASNDMMSDLGFLM